MGNNLCCNKTDSAPGQYVGAGGASETTRLTGDNVSDSMSKLSLDVCNCVADRVGVLMSCRSDKHVGVLLWHHCRMWVGDHKPIMYHTTQQQPAPKEKGTIIRLTEVFGDSGIW